MVCKTRPTRKEEIGDRRSWYRLCFKRIWDREDSRTDDCIKTKIGCSVHGELILQSTACHYREKDIGLVSPGQRAVYAQRWIVLFKFATSRIGELVQKNMSCMCSRVAYMTLTLYP